MNPNLMGMLMFGGVDVIIGVVFVGAMFLLSRYMRRNGWED